MEESKFEEAACIILALVIGTAAIAAMTFSAGDTMTVYPERHASESRQKDAP